MPHRQNERIVIFRAVAQLLGAIFGKQSFDRQVREIYRQWRLPDPLEDIAEASVRAPKLDLARASGDPSFQFISSLLVELPLMARSPGFYDSLEGMGFALNATAPVPKLLSEISSAIDRNAFDLGHTALNKQTPDTRHTMTTKR